MSDEDGAGKTGKRMARLKAMQARHDEGEPAAEASEAPAAAGGGGGQGRRAAIIQRVRQALSGPDGRIDQQKARKLLMFVRAQAADPNAPRHELAKRIAGMVKNLPAQQRQRLMAAAGIGGGGLGGAAGLGGGGPGAGPGARRRGALADAAGAAPQDAAAPAAGPAPTGEEWFDNLVDKL